MIPSTIFCRKFVFCSTIYKNTPFFEIMDAKVRVERVHGIYFVKQSWVIFDNIVRRVHTKCYFIIFTGRLKSQMQNVFKWRVFTLNPDLAAGVSQVDCVTLRSDWSSFKYWHISPLGCKCAFWFSNTDRFYSRTNAHLKHMYIVFVHVHVLYFCVRKPWRGLTFWKANVTEKLSSE